MTPMHRWLLATFALLVACPGPGGGGIDAGPDAPAISPDVGTDTGVSCVGAPEGAYMCTPGIQCCAGMWRTYHDGACLPRDAGHTTTDAGPPDCTGSPERAGCPCTAGVADVCVPFADSLRCVDGVWTTQVGISCCVSP